MAEDKVSCWICKESKRSDKMSGHFNQHIAKHLFNLSETQRASYVKDQNPVLLGNDAFGTERWAYCTVCHKGRFFYIRGHKDFGDWAKKHKEEGCGKLWNKVAVLFEAPEPPKERKQVSTVAKTVTTHVVVQDDKKIKELEKKIKVQDDEIETLYEEATERSAELDLANKSLVAIYGALLDAVNKAGDLPTQTDDVSQLLDRADYRKKLLAVLTPLYDLANKELHKTPTEEQAKDEEDD